MSNNSHKSKTYSLNAVSKWALLLGFPLLCVLLGVSGFFVSSYLLKPQSTVTSTDKSLSLHYQELQKIKFNSEQELKGLTVKLSYLQAQLLKLNALGKQLVERYNLPNSEFDFLQIFKKKPVNNSVAPLVLTLENNKVIQDHVKSLELLVSKNESLLFTLQSVLLHKDEMKRSIVSGVPVKRGWVSSKYGNRIDPFTGNSAWHAGIDYAAENGSSILSMAKGVVTWAGIRSGYGTMVEVDHGNGLLTRYAHAQKAVVKIGDLVNRNDIIAKVGSSGRSTGPHLHLEVYKNGRTVDPLAYLQNTPR
jgi:murein DD-endopeptidase MepM/ murein hydrolase activator NlpD